MAAPIKEGLDYFPLRADYFLSETVAGLHGEFGTKGELVYLRLLCAIYRRGYFAQWDGRLAQSLRNQVAGASVGLVEGVVRRLVADGTFDKTLFERNKVLTSAAIQETYFLATKKRKKPSELPHLLVNVANNPMKEKETKEKKSAMADEKKAAAAAAGSGSLVENVENVANVEKTSNAAPPSLAERVRIYYNRKRGRMAECTRLNKATARKIDALAAEYGKDCIRQAIDAASLDSFCQGRNRGFIPTLPWLLERRQFDMLLSIWDAQREQAMRRRQPTQRDSRPAQPHQPPQPQATQQTFEQWAAARSLDPADPATIAQYLHLQMVG